MTGDERLVRDIVRQHCLPNTVWADQNNIRRFLDEVERQDRYDRIASANSNRTRRSP